MGTFEHYISVGRGRLRCGYTTGTCAPLRHGGRRSFCSQGDARSGPGGDARRHPCGSRALRAGVGMRMGLLCGPEGRGDDPDATHGTFDFAKVEKTKAREVTIEGGWA